MADNSAAADRSPHEGQSARPEPLGTTPPPPADVTHHSRSLAHSLANSNRPGDSTPTIISKNTPIQPRTGSDLSEDLRGRFLAHFELIAPIGVGGMAAVLRARDTQLDRIVALKVLPPEMAADPEHVRRFQQEARSAAKLDHENIARVYYGGQDQGLLFIAFEFVEGQNLRALLERRGRLPVTEAIHYILQVATGLAHAGERGVVHRDIKPSNIIITPSGRAKLVDMGLARSLGPQPDGGLTQSGVTLGTFDYISPEQALEPRDADVRSDIYSLGCTFYHMLTGQPPVPEGTAARKLYCHQHVPPVDPRQLNPAIPDDVAVVLARMMAKEPGDRYQQPEQLVQHLMVLAQKLGASTSNPDGVLFMDAPLPSPPHMRPALLMAAAIVLLVAFIVFLGAAPGPGGNGRSSSARHGLKSGGESTKVEDNGANGKTAAAATPEKPAETQPAPTPTREPVWFTPENAKDLADYLDRTEVARVVLTKDLKLEEVQLSFHGHSLEMKAANTDPKARPTLRLDYTGSGNGQRWAALTIRGDARVVLTGLRFEVNATQAEIQMAAVAHQGTGRVTVRQCEFVQLDAPDPTGRGRLSSVAVTGTRGAIDLPQLDLHSCWFAPGQEAVTLSNAGHLRATECAFAPHSTALFHLRGRGKQDSELALTACTALLAEGTVFRLADSPACKLTVHDSLFSRPETDAETGAALIVQTGSTAREFDYHGNGNGYHNLGAYWVKAAEGASETIRTLKDFNRDTHVTEGELSAELTDSPWEAKDPLALVAQAPRNAFRLKTDQAGLRRGDAHTPRLVGVNSSAWGSLYEKLPRLDDKKPEGVASRKVVDPLEKPGNGVYTTLEEAVASAKSGDEIRLRTNNRLRVEPIRLQKPNFTLTIQAEPRYHPVLTLSGSPEREVSLFYLYDGQLTLKGLSLQLETSQEGRQQQSLVTLLGPAQCTLQDCQVTLAGVAAGADAPHLAVITLADPSSAMKMEPRPPRTMPDVDILNCIVRGEGDLLAVRASRPFDLNVSNALLALRGGSLLNVEASAENLSGQDAWQTVNLSQVTAYLGEHLLFLRAARNARGLLKTVVTAHECLFAAANGKALIHLDGMENEDQVRGLLAWHGKREQPNVYSGFPMLLDQSPRAEDTMLRPFDRDRWRAFTGESEDARFKRVQFTTAPAADEPWTRILPAHFRLKPNADLPKCGADLDELTKRFEIPEEE